MAAAPHPRPLPAARRTAAVRRFPLGCGRHRNAAPQPQRADPFATTRDALTNPSAETTSSPPRQRRLPTTHVIPGTEGPDRGGGNGPVAEAVPPTAIASTARRVSAVRRFPPGCGRVVAVPKPEATTVVEGEGKAEAGELAAAVRNSGQKDKDVPCRGDSGSNGGGDDGGVQQGECGVRPCITTTGIMSVPLVPWAHRGRRSEQRRRQF